MDLIIGGAYMGKRTFAMKQYGFSRADIFSCSEHEFPDFSKSCVANLEAFVLYCVREQIDPVHWWQEHRDLWQNAVLLCRDISSGIVPLQPEERRWREETGRLLQYLAGEAQHVYRVFCGLGVPLK